MPLSFELPNNSLLPYVNSYFYYHQEELAPVQNVTATGYQFFWYVLKGNVSVNLPPKGSLKLPQATMLGHFSHACTVNQTFPSRVAAISFKPFGCHALFGFDMQKFKNYFLDLKQIESVDLTQLGKLDDHADIVSVKNVFDSWLMNCMEVNLHETNQIPQIIELMNQKHGSITIEEITQIFSITERSLQRQFNKIVGINPKLYLRILRCSYVVGKLSDESKELSDVIFEAGYFDQSHFIKDFLQFVNCNPSAFKMLNGYEISRQTIKAILQSN